MEDAEQDNDKDGNTPNLVSEHLIRLVGLAHLELILVLALHNRREVLGNILVSAVGNKRLEVGAERVVGKSFLKLVDHVHGFFVHAHFYFVAFYKLDCVEKRIFDVLTFKCDSYVVDKVGNRSVGKHAGAGARNRAFGISPVHKLFKSGLLQCGNLDDGNAQTFFELLLVDFVAVLLCRVHRRHPAEPPEPVRHAGQSG